MASIDKADLRLAAERGDAPLLPAERMWGFWEFTYANSALAIATWAFLIGGATALFVGVKAGIAAIVIGNILGVLIMALSSCIAAGKYGTEQFTFLRSQFGVNGSRLVYLLAVVFLTMGWLAVLGLMFGRSIDSLTGLVTERAAEPQGMLVYLAAFFAIVLTAFIVARGPTSIKVFNTIIAPTLVLIMGVMLYLIFSNSSWSELMALPAIDEPFEDKHLNFMIAVEVNMAAGFSWWPYIGNLARLSKNERTAFWPNIVGVFGAAVLGEIVGLLAAARFGDSDPTVWMMQIGGFTFGIIALGFIAFANVTSMANILYTSIVGLRQVVGERLRHISWELLVVLFCIAPVVIVFTVPGIYDGFFIFLVWTSALNSALAGIGIADYFLLRRQRVSLRAVFTDERLSPFRYWAGFNPVALVALVVGFATYVLIFNPQTLENSTPFAYLSASLPSCVLAGIVHIAGTRLFATRFGWGDYPRSTKGCAYEGGMAPELGPVAAKD
ncbi:cytosine/uracil/thiamine/allantoin permease [Marinobacterium nitratireducens]|uniref:Cytosine/uracil/thiamine/allantoin permease n=1 Tax=Marinobacterium nitratireducens TaxID=518897 RepID=A0A917ZJ52_9GAMM|nr:cytosine permease [Marinobacterium nitratireducens]GGO84205.1 cytosine/uracil/thiamine/allantoin permease [Marinobacterium nitratireducens]